MLIRRRAVILGGMAALSGCASSQPKPTTIKAEIITDAIVNPTLTLQSAPVQVRFYFLKAESVFMQTDAQTLLAKDAAILGPDMLGKRELVVAPGAKESLTATAPDGTAFLGVAAAFRALEYAQWRQVVSLEQHEENKLEVNVRVVNVEVAFQEKKGLWPF